MSKISQICTHFSEKLTTVNCFHLVLISVNFLHTVIFLSYRSGQTVQTQIGRLLIRVYTVCNSLCIFWMHYSKEMPSCSTFRVITIIFYVICQKIKFLLYNKFLFYIHVFSSVLNKSLYFLGKWPISTLPKLIIFFYIWCQ